MVEPFDETELENLNNFYLYINPAYNVVPGPSVYRWMRTEAKSLDQPGEQFLSAIEKTAAEISGSFEAAQIACCKWYKTLWVPPDRPMTGLEYNQALHKHEQLIESNAEWQADRKAWKELQNRIYQTLRQRGYARHDLIG